jgi:thioredoxin 1
VASAKVVELTTESFQGTVLDSDRPVLVDFWAEWCGPCRMIEPIIDQIAEEREDLLVCKLDVDTNHAIAQRYGITGIPFIGLFRDGNLVKQAVGAMPRPMLERALGLDGG